jgi:polar amino acid transport system substrate-binding protein/two-component system sensor histidine kinase EvgS
MVNLILKFFILLLLVYSGAVANVINSLSDEEKEWIQKHKQIKFTGDPNWLPFEAFTKDGKYIGIVADFLKIIEERTGLEFQKIPSKSWSDAIKLLQSHQVQMITATKDLDVGVEFLLTENFLKNKIVVIMQSGSVYVDSVEALKNKSIVIIKNYGYTTKIKKKYPSYNFIEVNDVNEGLFNIAEGKYDAMLTTMSMGSYMITDLQLSNLAVVGKTEFTTALAFRVDKEYEPLVSIVNKVLLEISKETKQQILNKWVNQDYIEKTDYTLILQIALVLSLIIAATLFWSIRLKREIARRIVLEKENERMLAQQAKHAALGEMMDAIAHQWKQPLNAISMMNELLLMEYKEKTLDEAYLKEYQNDMNTQVEHLLTTLNEFRTFFRPDKQKELFNLLESIEAVLLLMKDDLLKNTIEVEVLCDKEIKLHFIKNEFKHILLNILSNARDAFVENNIEHRKVKIEVFEHKDVIVVEISDNAGGIPEHILPTIFEANVTTKKEGKGTGIGLYMSQQIAKKMSAKLSASNANEGALFRLEIPHT